MKWMLTEPSGRTMYLPEILAHTRSVVEERKAAADMRLLAAAAARHVPRGFARALRARQGMAVIAELKKASPSKGIIREEFDPVEIAVQLEAGGATALSVLTDEKFFQGSLANLRRASAAVWLPCLRKDFMVDEFQMLEARANRADAVLLIVAALTDAELKTLRKSARSYGLDVLCEVHNAEELERALPLECECVGVNSRDLKTFEVSLDRACELAQRLPKSSVRVAESGIHTQADMKRLRAAGFDAFLIGESLMRESKPGGALASLLRGGLKQVDVY
jgi:indole-3-glycerol phosphate synthase